MQSDWIDQEEKLLHRAGVLMSDRIIRDGYMIFAAFWCAAVIKLFFCKEEKLLGTPTSSDPYESHRNVMAFYSKVTVHLDSAWCIMWHSGCLLSAVCVCCLAWKLWVSRFLSHNRIIWLYLSGIFISHEKWKNYVVFVIFETVEVSDFISFFVFWCQMFSVRLWVRLHLWCLEIIQQYYYYIVAVWLICYICHCLCDLKCQRICW